MDTIRKPVDSRRQTAAFTAHVCAGDVEAWLCLWDTLDGIEQVVVASLLAKWFIDTEISLVRDADPGLDEDGAREVVLEALRERASMLAVQAEREEQEAQQ
jgi:hypothetical protein